MAKPASAVPDEATNSARPSETGDGEAALRDVIDRHGEQLAAALEQTDEIGDLFEMAVLMIATADEDELEYLTDSSANLIDAADGISTAETAELAADVGANADELAAALDTVVELQRAGTLDELVTIATMLSDSLSPEEVEDLATVLEENNEEMIEALDVVLELQRDGHLSELIALAKPLSTVEIDADTAAGLNTMLSAVGAAQRNAEPIGILGLVGRLRSRNARAGLGFLAELLTGLGRRLRRDE